MKNFRFISAILILPLLLSLNSFAQSDEELVQQYMDGVLQITTQHQKDVISRYIDENIATGYINSRQYDNPRVPFFSEDFSGTSGGTVGTTPPTGWQSVINPGGNAAQPWEFYSDTYSPNAVYLIPSGGGFAGDYAVLNSDNYGSGNTQNASLITPPINCTGKDNIYLSYSEAFRQIGASSGTVSVSTDGGTTWIDLLVRTGVNVGYPNPAVETSMIVPQATNQPDVRFRFTYEGTWGYWWAIDNVTLEEGSPLAPLVGGNIYPINGTQNPPASFENITSSLAYMDINGITGTGQVIFELSTGYAGTEPGPVSIGPIMGASSDLGVTFRPAPGYTAVTDVPGGASPNQHAIALDGCSYVTLDGRAGGTGSSRDWTIKVSGTTNAQMAVRLRNSAGDMTDIHIRNLIMIGEAASITGAVFQFTGTTANSISNVIVEDNLITSSATSSSDTRGYGITVATTNAASTNIVIRNNDVTNFYARGINITSPTPYLKVHDNRFYHTDPITQPSVTEFSAIYFSSTSVNGEGTEIYNNMIYGIQLTNHSTTTTVGINGIYFLSAPTGVDPIRIYNNMISIGDHLTGTAADMQIYGIRENTSSSTNPTLDIFYNSVYIGGELTSGSNNSAAFRKQLTSNLNLSNNIFFNARSNNVGTGTHWAIMVNNTSFSSLSNNAYFVNGVGGVLGTTTGTTAGNQANLPDWQIAVAGDPGSVFTNPNFISPAAMVPDLKINATIPTPLESGAIEITGITTDFEDTPRFPNPGYPINPLFPPSAPDIGAHEFAGEPVDISPPVIDYMSLSNTSSLANRNVTATITDASGVMVGANGPRVYFKKNTGGTYLFDANPTISGDDFTFVIDQVTLAVAVGDTVYYYFAAQDSAGNAGTNPPGGSGINPPGTTAPDNPDSYLIIDAPMVGDYTIGVTMFRTLTGIDITFEERTRTVEKVMNLNEYYLNPELYEVEPSEFRINADGTVEEINIPEYPADPEDVQVVITYDETYFVPMLNGVEYTGELYYEPTPQENQMYNLGDVTGVYPTITAALDDVMLRGVGGAVRFLLLDSLFNSETLPIVFGDIPGISSTNTVSMMPAAGVTSEIIGSINQPIIRLSEASHITIDGRQNGATNPGSLTITNESTVSGSHTIQFIDGSTFNTIQYCVINNATAGTAGPRAVDFSTSLNNPDGNSNNMIYGNHIVGGRTGVGFAGTVANPNENNVIEDNDIYDFGFAGIWLSSNSHNTTIRGNSLYNTTPGISVAHSGMNIGAMGGVNEISGNHIFDMQNTATSSIRGITLTGSAGSVWNIFNNFFSFTEDNGTKTSIYAIQNTGTAAVEVNVYYNTFRFGGMHTGGTSGVIVSGGYIKGNTGADATHRYKNNIALNTRTGGTSGVVHLGTFIGNTNGTMDVDYNTNWAFGDPGSFHAGWDGFVYNNITDYKTAAMPHEQNANFKETHFVSNIDLHLAGTSVGDFDLGGTPIAGIAFDIDGDARHPDFPYRGADEADIPFAPITAPSNLMAVADTFFVMLNWTDNSNNEAGFVIERKDGDSLSANPYVEVGSVLANVTTFTDTGLTPNTTYTYRVKAVNPFVESDYSNQEQTTTIIPVELTAFSASVHGRDVLINWSTATETNNRGFDLQRKIDDNWENLAFIEGSGTITEPRDYSFTDKFEYKSFEGTITYRLKQIDYNGAYHYSNEINVEVDFTPTEYTLYQNYPNPFNPATTIKFALPYDSNVRVSVYNILGELVAELANEVMEVGYHDVTMNAVTLASGVYIYTIHAKSVDGLNEFSSVKKMMLLK